MGGIVVDAFAGGGGASSGIRAALGRDADIAINHSGAALAMHAANHPDTSHYCEDVFDVDPHAVCRGRPVRLMWASPDCTHFSRAKGAQPRSQKTRGLAYVVITWAKAVRPAVIMVENVPEFAHWGPLNDQGRALADRAGETFREWVGSLEALGYRVEWRELVGANFGAPTIRKRLFVIARCDGVSISWPTPTHGPGQSLPWRSASEIIDWTLPCPSIFDRRRPLADATLRRIGAGLQRCMFGGTEDRSKASCLIQTGYGERLGQAPRVLDLTAPLTTVVGSQKHALVVGFISRAFGGGPNGVQPPARQLSLPLSTVTAKDHHMLVTTALSPASASETRAFLAKYYGASGKPESQLQAIAEPLHTATTRARFALVKLDGIAHQITDIGLRMLSPKELFAAQGFPPGYILDVALNGRALTKTKLVELAGNSVCPQVAEALVRANLADLASERAA